MKHLLDSGLMDSHMENLFPWLHACHCLYSRIWSGLVASCNSNVSAQIDTLSPTPSSSSSPYSCPSSQLAGVGGAGGGGVGEECPSMLNIRPYFSNFFSIANFPTPIPYSYSFCECLQSKLLLGLSHCHLVQVLDVIHHLDVVETLISDGTSTPEDWAWVKQLRHYKTGREGNAGVLVKMADAALNYSWEYQGNAPKLVYTPLTDRCYLTLTQVTDVTHVP